MLTVPRNLQNNLIWRRKAITLAQTEPKFRDVLMEACSQDILTWINGFVWTIDPRRIQGTGSKNPFLTFPVQETALAAMERALWDGKDLVIEKSRDMGASWLCLLWMLWRWTFQKHQKFLVFSRNEKLVDGQEDSLFSHLDFVLKNLPPWMKPPTTRIKLKLKNDSNGSVIEGDSTTEDIGRGGRRTAILWDEAAAFEHGGYSVAASTADNTNTRLINSTPQGEDTYFYEVRHNPKHRGVRRVRLHWSEHPSKRRGLYRPGKDGPELLDDWTGELSWEDQDGSTRLIQFPSEYTFSSEVPRGREGLRSPWYDNEVERRASLKKVAQELDIDDSGSVSKFVDGAWADQYVLNHCQPPKHEGEVDATGFHTTAGGGLRLWCDLDVSGDVPKDRGYVVACDISEGTGSSDSVATIVDKYTKSKVGEFASNKLMIADFAQVVVWICELFTEHGGGKPLLIWEGNGPGRTFKRIVVDRLHYPRIWFSKNDKRIGDPGSQMPGWFSEGESRDALLRGYREALCGRPPFHNPSERAIRELCRYEYKGDKIVHPDAERRDDEAGDHKKNHGDRVIADALAVLALGPITVPASEVRPSRILPGSLAWRRKYGAGLTVGV